MKISILFGKQVLQDINIASVLTSLPNRYMHSPEQGGQFKVRI